MTKPKVALVGMAVGATLSATAVLVIGRPSRSAPVLAALPACEKERDPEPRRNGPKVVSASCDELRRSVQVLEAEAAEQAGRISDDPYAVTPVAFPKDFPETHRDGVFRRVLQDALRDCLSAYKLEAVNCDEPPCLAAIRIGAPVDDPKPVFQCESWKRTYGRSLGIGGFDTVDCGDGRQEMVEIISPDVEAWEGWKQLSDATRRHIERRRSSRAMRLLDDHECSASTR